MPFLMESFRSRTRVSLEAPEFKCITFLMKPLGKRTSLSIPRLEDPEMQMDDFLTRSRKGPEQADLESSTGPNAWLP